MQKLIHGLNHFQNYIFSSKEDLFQRLSKGQTPDALFITCSDSRINPNLITNTEPGELFILRNAGNIIPAYGASESGGELATIEFAVVGLGVKDIIICGHSNCGAMGGLINPKKLEKLPILKRWLAHAQATRMIVEENYSHLPHDEQVDIAIQENVLVQLEHLRIIPVVASRLIKGELNLHGWIYSIETGEVFYYDPAVGQFLPLNRIKSENVGSVLKRAPVLASCI